MKYSIPISLTWFAAAIAATCAAPATKWNPTVELEETVYSYTPAENGAGPMWCSGSTTLVRSGTDLFATGLETLPGEKPLNNCRWVLFRRDASGWKQMHVDSGHTREPSPIAAFHDGRILVSANPTLGKGTEPNGGPARPAIAEFKVERPDTPARWLEPVWDGSPVFREHSYRSLATDGSSGELILFQNIDYTHAEWAFLDRSGQWSARGKLKWPWGAEYDKPGPIRVCYPNVALHDRAVWFFGVSDILEPYKNWKDFKQELTGRQWDYDFRRLFLTWTPDIRNRSFSEWIEVASRDKTCGWISPGDLWVAPDGNVHLLWSERALDERLRARFFPNEKQRHSLEYANFRQGKIVNRRTLVESLEDQPGIIATAGRFHATPDRKLLVMYHASGTDAGKAVSENRIVEILPDGSPGTTAVVPLKVPFVNFFTATERAGSKPSDILEILGTQASRGNTISFARIRLRPSEKPSN